MQLSNEIQTADISTIGARVPLLTVKGKEPGPRLVVVGDEDVLRGVADIAWNFPNISTISGTLILRAAHSDLGLDRAKFTYRLDAEQDTDPEKVLVQILLRMTDHGMFAPYIANAA